MSRFNDHTIIVTGAASGIGRATADRLAAEGARVIGADIAAPADASWEFVTTDVTYGAQVDALVGGVDGRIDGIVTAAGVAGGGPIHLLDDAEWQRVMAINITGTFACVRAVVRRMLDQEPRAGERGSIVTVASVEGIEGTAGGSAYNASKGAVVLLTKNIAIDYGPKGIRANALCPGFIDTPMMQAVFGTDGIQQVRDDMVHEHALRRTGRPEEMAAVAAFLLSSDASFVSGHAMVADGGYTAGRDHQVTELMGLS